MVAMVDCLLNGRWPLKLPEHRAVRPQWTQPPYWEPERIQAMSEVIGPGDVVYDVGAEEGDMPGLWASWGADVVLFEPNPRVWPNVKAVWEANDLRPPLATYCGFAADSNSEQPHYTTGVSRGWPASADGPVIGDHGFCVVHERPDIPRITIDSMAVISHRPTVITLDVEGAELLVLRGSEHILRTYFPIVFASIHPQFMVDSFGQTADEVHAFMASVDYFGTHLATDHEEHWRFDHRTRWPHG